MARKNRWVAGTRIAGLVLGSALHLSVAVADEKAMLLPVDPTPLMAETATGERSFSIEIADDPDERSMGLMHRRILPADRGMLFVFDSAQPVSFWMKNTPLPLDLVFIGADGRVRAIKQGEPFSEAAISPGVPVRYVLELNAGTARRLGIAKDTLIRHPEIRNPG